MADPVLLYLAITLRIILFYIPITTATNPIYSVWDRAPVRLANLVPAKFQTLTAAFLLVAVILIGAFVSGESLNNTRENRAVGLFELVVLLFVLWAT